MLADCDVWQVAIQYHEQIGAVKIVEMFESFGSNEGGQQIQAA